MNRRRLLNGLCVAGTVGLAGCLTTTEEPDSGQETVRITVVNRLEGEFSVDIAILEPGQSFSEGIGWRIAFGMGEDEIEIVEDELSAAEYRIVLRSEGYEDYVYDWARSDCIELSIKIEVTPEGFREAARSCRKPR